MGLAALSVLVAISLPWFWRLSHPFPYREAIFYQARRVGLDPFLVAAVVKVESGFRPEAESPRGARGLMQLMPETGRWVAEQLGLAYDPAYLFDPYYNLQLGTWYLAHLHEEFGDNIILALAAYNGGRGKVREWLERGQLARIDQIPYPETRQFVARVLHNYRLYRRLYGPSQEAEEWKGWLAERLPH